MKTKKGIAFTAKYLLLVCSLIFIAVGILNQEQLIVFRKAVNICLECIGIG